MDIVQTSPKRRNNDNTNETPLKRFKTTSDMLTMLLTIQGLNTHLMSFLKVNVWIRLLTCLYKTNDWKYLVMDSLYEIFYNYNGCRDCFIENDIKESYELFYRFKQFFTFHRVTGRAYAHHNDHAFAILWIYNKIWECVREKQFVSVSIHTDAQLHDFTFAPKIQPEPQTPSLPNGLVESLQSLYRARLSKHVLLYWEGVYEDEDDIEYVRKSIVNVFPCGFLVWDDDLLDASNTFVFFKQLFPRVNAMDFDCCNHAL